jgi:hypothetical protein
VLHDCIEKVRTRVAVRSPHSESHHAHSAVFAQGEMLASLTPRLAPVASLPVLTQQLKHEADTARDVADASAIAEQILCVVARSLRALSVRG